MPSLEERTTELLQRLIRFNTVNPPGNEEAAQEFLKGTLEAAGFECELLAAVEGGRTWSLGWERSRMVLGSRCWATSTRCSRTPTTGASTRGRASFATAVCGAAARST